MKRGSMEASSSYGASRRPRPRTLTVCGGGISSLGVDLLCAIFALLDYFDIARCSAVCNSWHNAIHSSTLMIDLYAKKLSKEIDISDQSTPSKKSIGNYLHKLAMGEHTGALSTGSAVVHQWTCHSSGVSQCRLHRGVIATGVGDKMLRLWSAERYNCLGDYSIPDNSPLVDFDFDESKTVGLIGSRLCIWRRSGKRSLSQPFGGSSRSLCMRYIDPEAVVGCEDGRARVFDMYSGSCSRIIRMHGGPITCLGLDEQLIFVGSSSGYVTLADHSSGEWIACLKSSISPLGITCLCFDTRSHMVFAGSTAGYSHCWDLRTLRPLWETRISSNITYTLHHLSGDSSTLAAGGIDGILRVLDQKTGEVLSSYVADRGTTKPLSDEKSGMIKKRKAIALPEDTQIDRLSKDIRPTISSVAVGMKKIVTLHNDKYIRVWKFD